jgi:hypothetical protein
MGERQRHLRRAAREKQKALISRRNQGFKAWLRGQDLNL